MAQVAVTIAGRTYRMACADGEEAHLEALATDLDTRINDLRTSFGEIGDQRLTVMAALAIADEKQEIHSRIAALEAEVARLRATSALQERSTDDWAIRAAEAIEGAAERIERVVAVLNAPGRE